MEDGMNTPVTPMPAEGGTEDSGDETVDGMNAKPKDEATEEDTEEMPEGDKPAM